MSSTTPAPAPDVSHGDHGADVGGPVPFPDVVRVSLRSVAAPFGNAVWDGIRDGEIRHRSLPGTNSAETSGHDGIGMEGRDDHGPRPRLRRWTAFFRHWCRRRGGGGAACCSTTSGARITRDDPMSACDQVRRRDVFPDEDRLPDSEVRHHGARGSGLRHHHEVVDQTLRDRIEEPARRHPAAPSTSPTGAPSASYRMIRTGWGTRRRRHRGAHPRRPPAQQEHRPGHDHREHRRNHSVQSLRRRLSVRTARGGAGLRIRPAVGMDILDSVSVLEETLMSPRTPPPAHDVLRDDRGADGGERVPDHIVRDSLRHCCSIARDWAHDRDEDDPISLPRSLPATDSAELRRSCGSRLRSGRPSSGPRLRRWTAFFGVCAVGVGVVEWLVAPPHPAPKPQGQPHELLRLPAARRRGLWS